MDKRDSSLQRSICNITSWINLFHSMGESAFRSNRDQEHGVDHNGSHPESLSCQGRFSSTGLQRVVRTVEKINWELTSSHPGHAKKRCLTRTHNIRRDTSQPHHGLFLQLDSGKRLHSLWAEQSGTVYSFFPYAIRLLNTKIQWLHIPTPAYTHSGLLHLLEYNNTHVQYILYIVCSIYVDTFYLFIFMEILTAVFFILYYAEPSVTTFRSNLHCKV